MNQDKIEIVSVFRNIKKTLFSFVLTNVKMKDNITEEFKSLLLKLWTLGKSKVVKRRESLIFFSKFEVPNDRFSVGETIYKIKQPFQFVDEDPSLIIESNDISFPDRLKSKLKDKIILKEPLSLKKSSRTNFIENIEVDTPTEYIDDDQRLLVENIIESSKDSRKLLTKEYDTRIDMKPLISEGNVESKKLDSKQEEDNCDIEPEFQDEICNNIKMLKEINFLEEGKFTVKKTKQFYYAVMNTKCGNAWGDVLTNRGGYSDLYDGRHLNITRLSFFQLYYL